MSELTSAHQDWPTVIQLPTYALDLNSLKGVWANMKNVWCCRKEGAKRPAILMEPVQFCSWKRAPNSHRFDEAIDAT